GASLGYQIAAVFGGGLAPFLMVLLLEVSGTSMAVSGYIMLLALISLASIYVLAKRAREREREREGQSPAPSAV
ncbi:MAG: MFS transporter, partial [Streptomyces sp.]